LSSDGPIYVIDTENGTGPLADKFPDANVINISSMDKENVEEKDEVKNFEVFMEVVDYLVNLPDKEVGTIVIDSISDIWEWAQAYGIINKLYLKSLKKLINKNCNLILTARASETYVGAGQPSGRYEPKCQKNTGYWVDFVLYHQVKFVNKDVVFQAKIEKSRFNGNLLGHSIDNPTLKKLKEMLK
jgi:hypothetical protein